jgi:hypothetical protein
VAQNIKQRYIQKYITEIQQYEYDIKAFFNGLKMQHSAQNDTAQNEQRTKIFKKTLGMQRSGQCMIKQ